MVVEKRQSVHFHEQGGHGCQDRFATFQHSIFITLNVDLHEVRYHAQITHDTVQGDAFHFQRASCSMPPGCDGSVE